MIILENTTKLDTMINTPIPKLICTMAVPTIISMMITSVYNMADTYFVGRLGTSATGAVGVAFSLMAIIQAIGFTLGMGSGNYISRLLGAKKEKLASSVAATGFFTALALGTLVMIFGLIFLQPLTYLLGATDTIAPYAIKYIRWILIGSPYMAATFVLNNLLRYQGSAVYSMIGIGVGGVLNVVLDPLFIFVFKMGIEGAAIATILSQLVSFCILLVMCGRGQNIRIHIKNFAMRLSVFKSILSGGLPSFYRQGLASVSMICLNFAAGPFGDAAIAAMSIVSKVFQFALSMLLGFGQGFQPVCGFNYGAKRFDRVLEAFWFCLKIAVILLSLLGVVGFIFAPQIISIFRKDDIDVIRIGTNAIRYQSITFVFSAWIVMCNMLMQTIGKSVKASILAMARQGVFFLPLVLILPRLFGVIGVEIAQPVADVFTFILALPLGISVIRELKNKESIQ